MLTELCQELNNYFDKERHFGTFTIADGTIAADFLVPGQYYRVVGSIFNDGVHKYGSEDLTDETFKGSVWALAIPAAVINLAAEIAEWQRKYGGADSAAMSPFQSESFGGYSYSKGSAGVTGSGVGTVGWQSAFRGRLNRWRKL